MWLRLLKILKLSFIHALDVLTSLSLPNKVAIELDREEKAEMSCIAGVGGGVPSLVKKAKSGRPIVALDGCQLHCVQHCLRNQGIEANKTYTLTDYGIKKQYHMDVLDDDVQRVKTIVLEELPA